VAANKGAVREKKRHTTGAVAANLHEGSLSEIITGYLFASWGTVTPVRQQDDHGVIVQCPHIPRIPIGAATTIAYRSPLS
jgi:hypothetical protein